MNKFWLLREKLWWTIMPGLHSRRDSMMRRERECEGYIRLVCHILNLFLSHLKALGNMSVNQSRVKGNKNVSNVLPCYRRFSHKSMNVYIRAYFVSFTSRQKSRRVPETRMWNRHYVTDESRNTYPENQFPKGHFRNELTKKNLTNPNPWRNEKKRRENRKKSWKTEKKSRETKKKL